MNKCCGVKLKWRRGEVKLRDGCERVREGCERGVRWGLSGKNIEYVPLLREKTMKGIQYLRVKRRRGGGGGGVSIKMNSF